MTPVDTLHAILADGARPDDPRWAEVGADVIGAADSLMWPAARANNGTLLRLDIYRGSEGICFDWLALLPDETCRARRFVRELPPTFWAHLARMTEGA